VVEALGVRVVAVVRCAGGGRGCEGSQADMRGLGPQDGSSLRLGRCLITSAPTMGWADSPIADPLWHGAGRHPHTGRDMWVGSVGLLSDLPDETRQLACDRDGDGRAFLRAGRVEV